MVLVVTPALGVKSIAQLIEHAKARPSPLAYASSGTGSITHLAAERFKRDTGVNLLHVPYKGGVPATAGVVTGEVGMYFSCISAAIPHIKSGRLTILGITLPKRSPLYPDVPALVESIPGFEMGCNSGFFAPGGTPRQIVARLHAEVDKAVQHPRMKDTLTANAAEPGPMPQAQFKAYVEKEMRDWGEIVRAAGLKVD